MNILNWFFKSLLSFIFPQKVDNQNIANKKYLCQLSFCLDDIKNIDIYCKLPSFDHNDVKTINNTSMIVAEFLYLLNNNGLQKQTLSLLEEEAHHNLEQKLFVDNVMFYLSLLDIEKGKNKTSGNEPLVKPSKVFKI